MSNTDTTTLNPITAPAESAAIDGMELTAAENALVAELRTEGGAPAASPVADEAPPAAAQEVAVSYTHLTLPTIYSV